MNKIIPPPSSKTCKTQYKKAHTKGGYPETVGAFG